MADFIGEIVIGLILTTKGSGRYDSGREIYRDVISMTQIMPVA